MSLLNLFHIPIVDEDGDVDVEEEDCRTPFL